MAVPQALTLAPFVPSGARYDETRRLFAELGFEELWEHNGYAGFKSGGGRFILQRFDDEEFASNFMLRLDVTDLDAWWQSVSDLRLDKKYEGFRLGAITDNPWGREAVFIDLAGVCWHVGESGS
jgi:catechol 2,3-dioxygenase-like lactoylglutathione lyase family enzyme